MKSLLAVGFTYECRHTPGAAEPVSRRPVQRRRLRGVACEKLVRPARNVRKMQMRRPRRCKVARTRRGEAARLSKPAAAPDRLPNFHEVTGSSFSSTPERDSSGTCFPFYGGTAFKKRIGSRSFVPSGAQSRAPARGMHIHAGGRVSIFCSFRKINSEY